MDPLTNQKPKARRPGAALAQLPEKTSVITAAELSWGLKLFVGVLALLGGLIGGGGGGAVPGFATQSQLKSVDGRVGALEKQVGGMQEEQKAFRQETTSSLRHITQRLDHALEKRLTLDKD